MILELNNNLYCLFLLLSCGSGQQAANSGNPGTAGGEQQGVGSLSAVLIDVGKSAENAFYSFLELLSDTLGLRVTKDTTKSQVGDYFNSLGTKLEAAANDLEQVAVKSTADLEKDGLSNKSIRSAIDVAKEVLSTLKDHLDSLKDIGDSTNKVVGEVASQQNGVAAATDELKRALKALQGIVETAKTQQVKALNTSSVTLASNSIGVDAKDGAKVLITGNNAQAAAGDKAALIVSAVSGEEILASIVASQEGDADTGIGANATANTSAVAFAKGGATADHLAQDAALASAVSGGIALRSLVKGGKLASHNNNDEKAVQAAGISAVNKLLVAVEDVIKKTVKNVLKTAKEKIDEARAPKPAAQQ
ncbi:variable large family protein (plasmid) [Borrelia parkeri]|uniref:variable large family protein n=1 Tax=Borrelia parkeri TaxID=141 RepID=UPI001FF5010D|nr:variable large family protein [Borrelia parkeri]UPA11710.1 variable large family protein [Borrelia parkeri]